MRKSSALALSLALFAGPALASNTGFKLNFTLQRPNMKVSGNNWVSFPYFYYPNGNVGEGENARDVCWDLNEGDPLNTPKVTQVIRWDPVADKPLPYSCSSTAALGNFDLIPGRGVSMKPNPGTSPQVSIKVY